MSESDSSLSDHKPTKQMTNKKSMNKPRRKMDLSLFKNTRIVKTESYKTCKDFKKCIAIRRLLLSLRYYSSLNLKTNKDDQSIFISFVNEVYKQQLTIQDFYHLRMKHDDQIQDILNFAMKNGTFTGECDIDSCQFASRHYRVDHDRTSIKSDTDPCLVQAIDTMDSFHYYLFHLFSTGFRIDPNSIDPENVENKESQTDGSYDAELARVGNIISSTKESTQRFHRITGGSKFKIGADKDSETSIMYDDEQESFTFLDTVFDHLQQTDGIKQDEISKLALHLKEQKYDTESMDIDLRINDGNIAKYMKTGQCMDAVHSVFNKARSMYMNLCRSL